MIKQMGFVFNVDLCIGCKSCEVACKNENQTDTLNSIGWRRVSKLNDTSFISVSCNHCSSPECFRVCPENAFTKQGDGIVRINSELCNGCGICIPACPYGAPQYNSDMRKVDKCQMCYPRQEKGLVPACAEACSTNALKIVDLNSFHDKSALATIPGFPDIRLTNPSIVFYPEKKRKRYFIKE